jgi:hypothetical protein
MKHDDDDARGDRLRKDAPGDADPAEVLLEAIRYEVAKHEHLRYEPSDEELRAVEPMATYWEQRVAERRHDNLLARASATTNLAEKSREWLLARVAELRDIAQQIAGDAPAAYCNRDARALDDLATEELRSQVADLELVIGAALAPTR